MEFQLGFYFLLITGVQKDMFALIPLQVAKDFIDKINQSLIALGSSKLSLKQCLFISTCITGIIVTNSVCWLKFERSSLGQFCSERLSKMFRRSRIDWSALLHASIATLLKEYDIQKGVLVLDDTTNVRSKKTIRISGAHKVKDKSSGGFVNGQVLVMLLLVTDKISLPVGFCFYEPDPKYRTWKKEDKFLRSLGIAKKARPPKPLSDEHYLTKPVWALQLLARFKASYPQIKVQAILADALYGCRSFVNEAETIYPGGQVISQVRGNQKVRVRGKFISIEAYFCRYSGVHRTVVIRGKKETAVEMHGARLYLKAHQKKRFIVAVKYEGEKNYRYLVATNLTWRLTDIMKGYTLRWLVEVFIQDWKSYEGWCQLAKQPGVEGSYRGVILSLLTDHCLLFHPEQKALVRNKLPAATVGSLRDRERAKAVIESIQSLLVGDQVVPFVKRLSEAIEQVIPLRQSSKHMSGRDLGRLEPTPSLKYRATAYA